MHWRSDRSSRHRLQALVAFVGAGTLALAASLLPVAARAQSPTPTGTVAAPAVGGAAPTAAPGTAPTAPAPGGATPTATPAPAVDFAQHGFPTVAGSADFTPGSSATVTGPNQTLTVAGNFYPNPATIALLNGPPAAFSAQANGDTVLVAFAFRVTDKSTGQLVSSGFGAPFQYSFTGPAVSASTVRFNVTSATPPVVTVSGPPTISGQTASLSFSGSSVGWLLANPAQAAAPATAAAVRAISATPTTAAARAIPVAPPNTGVGPGPARTSALPPSQAAVSVAASPQLPNTGTGGLLRAPQPQPAIAWPVGLVAVLGALLLAGASWVRREAQ